MTYISCYDENGNRNPDVPGEAKKIWDRIKARSASLPTPTETTETEEISEISEISEIEDHGYGWCEKCESWCFGDCQTK